MQLWLQALGKEEGNLGLLHTLLIFFAYILASH